jgi:hypothetical protein
MVNIFCRGIRTSGRKAAEMGARHAMMQSIPYNCAMPPNSVLNWGTLYTTRDIKTTMQHTERRHGRGSEASSNAK